MSALDPTAQAAVFEQPIGTQSGSAESGAQRRKMRTGGIKVGDGGFLPRGLVHLHEEGHFDSHDSVKDQHEHAAVEIYQCRRIIKGSSLVVGAQDVYSRAPIIVDTSLVFLEQI